MTKRFWDVQFRPGSPHNSQVEYYILSQYLIQVLVIGYLNLEFICYLLFGACDFFNELDCVYLPNL